MFFQLLALLFLWGQPSGPIGNPPSPPAVLRDAQNFAVAELFTSQGCSSCPPADAVLADLDARARRTGEPLLVLSYHVDYWNYLGWADPFSSPHFSARQTDYTDRLPARTYTPQLVINGTTELIGSRRAQVTAAIDNALATPAPDHGLAYTVSADYRVDFTLETIPENAVVTALLVQPHATSQVVRGENRGRELSHVNVVRDLKTRPATASGSLALNPPNTHPAGAYEVVVLLQRAGGGPILETRRAR